MSLSIETYRDIDERIVVTVYGTTDIATARQAARAEIAGSFTDGNYTAESIGIVRFAEKYDDDIVDEMARLR